jgi:hypothetical protein
MQGIFIGIQKDLESLVADHRKNCLDVFEHRVAGNTRPQEYFCLTSGGLDQKNFQRFCLASQVLFFMFVWFVYGLGACAKGLKLFAQGVWECKEEVEA